MIFFHFISCYILNDAFLISHLLSSSSKITFLIDAGFFIIQINPFSYVVCSKIHFYSFDDSIGIVCFINSLMKETINFLFS